MTSLVEYGLFNSIKKAFQAVSRDQIKRFTLTCCDGDGKTKVRFDRFRKYLRKRRLVGLLGGGTGDGDLVSFLVTSTDDTVLYVYCTEVGLLKVILKSSAVAADQGNDIAVSSRPRRVVEAAPPAAVWPWRGLVKHPMRIRH